MNRDEGPHDDGDGQTVRAHYTAIFPVVRREQHLDGIVWAKLLTMPMLFRARVARPSKNDFTGTCRGPISIVMAFVVQQQRAPCWDVAAQN